MRNAKLLKLFLMCGLLGSTVAAKADPSESLFYNCNVSFNASGKSVYLGLGYTELTGRGVLSCYDLASGAEEDIPLKVKVRGPGAGLGVTGYNVSGGALGIGIKTSPEALLGEYLSVRGNAAVGVGVGVGTGLRVAKDAFVLTLSVQGQSGLGAGVDILSVELSEDRFRARVKTEGVQKARAEEAVSQPKEVVAEKPVASAEVKSETVVVENEPVKVRVGQSVVVVDESGRVLKKFTFSAPNTVKK